MKKTIFLSLILTLITINSVADVVSIERDSAYFLNSKVTSNTAEPSALQYYEFRENLPDEISIDIYKNKDMSALAGKKIFVGYGSVDPTGEDCKIFTPDVTGLENNISVCLPWWRIEREYLTSEKAGKQGTDFKSFIATMQRPRPPKNVSVCNSWQSSKQLPSGTVTCTTYYDKMINDECFNNPVQAQCKKNNCGTWVEENCERKGRSIGHENESLYNVEISSVTPQKYESKVNLVTEQFTCPGGSFTEYANCTDEVTVAMHPYECKPDNPNTPLDDSIMKYCDEDSPERDVATGKITGFTGTCPAESSNSGQPFQVTCRIDNFKQTKNICTEQGANITNVTSEIIDQSYDLHYTTHSVNILTGAVDVYSAREDCVRANTIDESREKSAYVNIAGSGYLDDDIYVTVHHSDDTHNVIYCNQQHNGGMGSKLNFPEIGGVIQCIANNGHYSFNQSVNIILGDVVSVQQATEREDEGYHGINGAFATRKEYGSSAVTIDNIELIPQYLGSNYPYTPGDGNFFYHWENTLGTLGIVFPYVSYYKLFFYTENGDLITEEDVSGDDFNALKNGLTFKHLNLAKKISINPALNANDNETLCLDDDWVEYGGGVFGGKKSKTGEACQSASAGNTYQKSKAIKRVVVKDMLTGAYTVIPLVYPLGYPNRVYISKLKLYEKREYFCYEEPVISAPY